MAHIIHPDVINFYNDAGYEIKAHYLSWSDLGLMSSDINNSQLLERYKAVNWFACQHDVLKFIVASTDIDDNDEPYWYNQKFYSEQEMLRLIKLKAFM